MSSPSPARRATAVVATAAVALGLLAASPALASASEVSLSRGLTVVPAAPFFDDEPVIGEDGFWEGEPLDFDEVGGEGLTAAAGGRLKISVPQAKHGAQFIVFSPLGDSRDRRGGDAWLALGSIAMPAGQTSLVLPGTPAGKYKIWFVYRKGSKYFGGQFVGGTTTSDGADIVRVRGGQTTRVTARSGYEAKRYLIPLASGDEDVHGTDAPAVVGTKISVSTSGFPRVTEEWAFVVGDIVASAPRPTYRPRGDDLGGLLSVYVMVYKKGRFPAFGAEGIGEVGLAMQPVVGNPMISGTAEAEHQLTGDPGSWHSRSSLSYQWYSDGAAIAGAVGTTLWVTAAMAGTEITFEVTATREGYATETALSPGETVSGSAS